MLSLNVRRALHVRALGQAWVREQASNTVGRRLILGAQQAGISAAGRALQERVACLMCSRVLGCLAAVMGRAKLLAPREQACPHPY